MRHDEHFRGRTPPSPLMQIRGDDGEPPLLGCLRLFARRMWAPRQFQLAKLVPAPHLLPVEEKEGKFMRSAIAAAFAAAVLFVPVGAAPTSIAVEGVAPLASGGYQMYSAAVEYGDLDISTSAGAASMLDRIDNAAAYVCGIRPDRIVPVSLKPKMEACRTKTVRQTVQAVNVPMLTTAAASK